MNRDEALEILKNYPDYPDLSSAELFEVMDLCYNKAKADHEKFIEDLKCGIYGKLNGNYPDNNLELYRWLEEIIDELSQQKVVEE